MALVAWNPIGFDVSGVVVSDTRGECRRRACVPYVRYLPLCDLCPL